MTWLLDADRLIEFLKGFEPTVALLNRLIPEGAAVSVIAYAEVVEGIRGSNHPDEQAGRFARLTGTVTLLPVTVAVADHFATLRDSLRRAGTPIPDMDLLIAATAIEHDLTLVTGNVRHFGRVPGLRLLSERA